MGDKTQWAKKGKASGRGKIHLDYRRQCEEMEKKLNLGCGPYIKQDCINLDAETLPGVDIVHNLNKYPYPFKDDEFDGVFCHHILEHLDDIIQPLEEIWRVSRHGARIIIEVPSFPGIGSVVDPTHKSFYTFGTFDYFTDNCLFSHYSKARYRILKRRMVFSYSLPPLKWLNKVVTVFVNSHIKIQKAYFYNFSNIFPASLLFVELETIKK
jgi:SAM-dependent methyltransferase